MTNLFKSFIKNESGATAIEYGLIASLVAVAAITAMSTVGTNLIATFNKIAPSSADLAPRLAPSGGRLQTPWITRAPFAFSRRCTARIPRLRARGMNSSDPALLRVRADSKGDEPMSMPFLAMFVIFPARWLTLPPAISSP